jgi:hypothetical protein
MAEHISGSRVIIGRHSCIEGTARLMMLDVFLSAEAHASTHRKM